MIEYRTLCSFTKDPRGVLKNWELYLRLTCIKNPMRYFSPEQSIHALVVDGRELERKIEDCKKYGYDSRRDWLFGIVDSRIPESRNLRGRKLLVSGPIDINKNNIGRRLANISDPYMEYHIGAASDVRMFFLKEKSDMGRIKGILFNPCSYRIEDIEFRFSLLEMKKPFLF